MGPPSGHAAMTRLLLTLSLVVAGGCSATEYNQRFDASLQQYRADSAAGRKGRAVARPVAVDAAAQAEGAPGAVPPGGVPPNAMQPGAVPPGAVPPGAAPGLVPPAEPQ